MLTLNCMPQPVFPALVKKCPRAFRVIYLELAWPAYILSVGQFLYAFFERRGNSLLKYKVYIYMAANASPLNERHGDSERFCTTPQKGIVSIFSSETS